VRERHEGEPAEAVAGALLQLEALQYGRDARKRPDRDAEGRFTQAARRLLAS
jgi:hypothetical protein